MLTKEDLQAISESMTLKKKKQTIQSIVAIIVGIASVTLVIATFVINAPNLKPVKKTYELLTLSKNDNGYSFSYVDENDIIQNVQNYDTCSKGFIVTTQQEVKLSNANKYTVTLLGNNTCLYLTKEALKTGDLTA